MRASMAYLAGAGTVIAAIGLGLGGGLTIANIVSPHKETREISKLEQRMAKPIPPPAEADQPKPQADQVKAGAEPNAPMPYLAATQPATSTPVAPAAPAVQPPTPQASPAPAPREPVASSFENANAKARDADLKRLAAEKRKTERRQQWAERQKAQQQRDAELRDADDDARRDGDGPRIVVQEDDDSPPRRDFGRPRRIGFPFPMINLFGGEDRD